MTETPPQHAETQPSEAESRQAPVAARPQPAEAPGPAKDRISTLESTRSLYQIILVEVVAMLCIAHVAASTLAAFGIAGCDPDPDARPGLFSVFAGLIGLGALAWVVNGTLRPKLLPVPVFHMLTAGMGGAHVSLPVSGTGKTLVPSTHPAYALAEIAHLGLFLIPAYIFGAKPALVGCEQQWDFVQAWSFVGVAALFPALRLIAWYVLRLQLKGPAVAQAPRAVIVPLAVMGPVVLFVVLGLFGPQWIATTVDAKRLAGGLAAHPEFDGRTLNVRGILMHKPWFCACRPDRPTVCSVATARLSLADAGEVVVRGIAEYGNDLRALGESSVNRVVTIYGKLTSKPPERFAGVYGTCQPDPFRRPVDGKDRAFLEMEGF